ncbi:glycosyltransferase family 1 protein [Nocardiopsis gilva YIM 90087]|uniref:Glycosyltransferase family 1 protein n=1 Tax=Nocardiopsis gilva YIM 90087 TaxID=1235441 RepID=A0A223S8Z5_9ACTN|nr:glycosyltransferase family 4 protein [Nocardiopsis gilva]ASU84594.1 glycosyltransferase family 1 protein [Nocardiopsis gilva YIM 90087]
MRVALVIGTSSGGVGNHVRSLSEGLVARGHRVAVIGPPETGEHFGFAATGARFAAVDIGALPRPGTDVVAAAKLSGLLARADVVHAHGIRAGALCALAGAAPLVVTVHNAPPELSGPRALVFPALERVVARRADVVLGVSSDLVDRMRSRGARRVLPAVVTAPPMPAARTSRAQVRAGLGISDARPLLLVVARLAAQKGLEVLLDAASMISAGPDEPAARAAGAEPPLIAVAGDGPLREALSQRIDAEDLPVRLLGHRSDIPDLLAAADMFVLPSLWEGPSLVIMEALRAGLPVVATRVGGIPDLYEDVALLVPPGDAVALADGATRVLGDPGLAAKMRADAARAAERLPTVEDTLRQVDGIYASLTGR